MCFDACGRQGNHDHLHKQTEPSLAATDGYQEIMDKIEEIFEGDVNLTQNRFEFLNSKQQACTLETFMIALQNKVEECEFGKTCADSLVASTFLTGLDDGDCRRHLLTIRRNFTRNRTANNYSSAFPKNPICSRGCRSHPAGQCRARMTVCHRCQRKGHFVAACEAAHMIEEEDSMGRAGSFRSCHPT